MPLPHTRLRKLGIPLHSLRNRPQRHLPPKFLHKSENAPAPYSTPILKVLFRVEVAATGFDTCGRTLLPEIRFADIVAVAPAALAAFFIVENEGDGDAGAVGPLAVVACFAKA